MTATEKKYLDAAAAEPLIIARRKVRELPCLLTELKTAQERVAALERQIAAGATAVETEAVRAQSARADSLSVELAKLKSGLPEAIRAAAELRVRASAVMPPGWRFDGMDDRSIMAAVIMHFAPKEQIGREVSGDYLKARFDSLVGAHMTSARSLTRIGELVRHDSQPVDSADERARAWRDQALPPALKAQ